MGLRNFVDDHPLAILAVVATAVATATVGVTQKLADQHLENVKVAMESDYKSEIFTLKNRLASIERKVGDDEKKYFDISRLVVKNDKVKHLDPSLISAEQGNFFYAQPKGNRWKHSMISEFGLIKMKMPDFDMGPLEGLSQVLGQKNINLWRRGDTLTINVTPKEGMEEFVPRKISFFPMVSVQVIHDDDFVDAVSGLGSFLHENSAFDELSDKLDQLINMIDSQTSETSSKSSISAASSFEYSESDSDLIDAKQEMEEMLSKVFRGDLVAVMLGQVIETQFQLNQTYDDVHVQINTIQKKGNVLYFQVSKKFKDITIDDLPNKSSFTVDTEVFMVTNSKSLYIVQTELPSVDGRHDALPWVSEWLSGIRIRV